MAHTSGIETLSQRGASLGDSGNQTTKAGYDRVSSPIVASASAPGSRPRGPAARLVRILKAPFMLGRAVMHTAAQSSKHMAL
jgi:hypothetical protein